MDEKQYAREIIEQMAKNEEKLSTLYAKCMHTFPSRHEFWNELANEEVSHARWIKTLGMRVEEGTVKFAPGRFNIDILNDFYSFIQKQELMIKEGMPLIQALVASKELEETLLEKGFFEVYQGDDTELEILLMALKFSTEKHREIVIAAWKEERKVLGLE